ncbi:MAG TPA: hypothetical protein VN213_10415 [Solirubrobacteraceae bacterium]|nr:hypothetical protein [Solirubrobacteraceae bacterium]
MAQPLRRAGGHGRRHDGAAGVRLREVGSPAGAGRAAEPPHAAAVRHFPEVSERYGYWNATPEENARVGLAVASAGGAN